MTKTPYEKNYPNKEWVKIDPEEQLWEYQEDPDDEETYCSGCFLTDDLDGNKVIDYDGCFELPRRVKQALSECGYDLSDL